MNIWEILFLMLIKSSTLQKVIMIMKYQKMDHLIIMLKQLMKCQIHIVQKLLVYIQMQKLITLLKLQNVFGKICLNFNLQQVHHQVQLKKMKMQHQQRPEKK